MKSTLTPEPFRPGLALPASLGMHGAVVAGIFIAASCQPKHEALIDPDTVMEVSVMEAMPKAERMPTKATRAPVDAGDPTAAPVPSEAPVATNSDMVDPEAQVDPGVDPDAQRRMEMEKAKLRAMMDAEAAEGTQDREATSAEGVEGAHGSGVGVSGPLARYLEKVRQAVDPNFNPVQKDPKLVAVVKVVIDRAGNVISYELQKGSGDGSFDAAAIRAMARTPQVPAPPADLVDSDETAFFVAFRVETGQ